MSAYKIFGQNPIRLETIEAVNDQVFLSWLSNIQADHPMLGMTSVTMFAEANRDCAGSIYAKVAGNELARVVSAARGAEYHEPIRPQDVVMVRDDFAY